MILTRKRKALKKDIKASEEDVKVIEDNALTNEEIDFKCNEVKIYCFSNGDKYIGKKMLRWTELGYIRFLQKMKEN